jgi:hypothetical protein
MWEAWRTVAGVATLREKKPGVWEVRVFTGTDARGCPTQISRTVRGGKRDAQRLAASLEVGPGSAAAAGRCVSRHRRAIDINGEIVDHCTPGPSLRIWRSHRGAVAAQPER